MELAFIDYEFVDFMFQSEYNNAVIKSENAEKLHKKLENNLKLMNQDLVYLRELNRVLLRQKKILILKCRG